MNAFRMPTRIHIEPGAAPRLGQLAGESLSTRAALVVDSGLAAAPWPDRLRRALRDNGVDTKTFDAVEANPRTHTAERIAEWLRAEGLGSVIGLGGGSVLDAAKAAAMLAANPGRALDFEGKNRFSQKPLPFFALPATCGTGSEATWVSVLTDEASGRKISVKGDDMYPDLALVDADILATLPPRLAAWTGMDALTHAIEATTGLAANPVSDALAEKAIALLFAFLPRAAADIAGDAEARAAVARAATLAGMAFGAADVGGVHCLSESIGARFDTPHGLANAVLLGPVLRYHLPFIEGRLAQLLAVVDPRADVREEDAALAARFLDRLDQLAQALAIPGFAALNVAPAALADIAGMAQANGSNPSNPQPMAAANYLEILAPLAGA